MISFFQSLFNLIKFTKINSQNKEFIFFSESKFYREHFLELILSFKKKGIENLVFISSDKDDVNFFKDLVKCYYIQNYLILIIFFNILNCKFLIMTLTGLGNPLPKSNSCKYYVYFFHALASTHQVYTKDAFKNYDIIFSTGNYQTEELKFAEKKFGLPQKEIVNIGYFFLDHITNKANLNKKKKQNILFAPSWNYNKNNLFDDYGLDIIKILLSNNLKITLRPHPEHYKRSNIKIDKIKKLFRKNKNFILEKNFSNLDSLEKAEILITDNSAIVFEFLFIFKRPIIYINYKEKIHNSDKDKITIKTIDQDLKETFGNIIEINDLDKLPSLCKDLIINNNLSSDKINQFSYKYLSNLNKSADYAVDYLVKKSNIYK